MTLLICLCKVLLSTMTEHSSTDLEKVFSLIEEKNVSVYTNEFDLAMFRVFFPRNVCKLGYLPQSCAFVNTLTPDIANKHKISVARTELESSLFSNISHEGTLYVHTLKGSPFEIEIEEEEEENKIVECEYIGSLFPSRNTKPLQITTVGVYSITSSIYNRQLCDLIKDKSITPNIIFDATSCVGGDTIGFALYLKCKVISLERDSVNFGALKNNIEAYNLGTKVKAIQGDFLMDGYKVIEENKPEIVYFDPPWGGKDYSIKKNIELFLSGTNVKSIVAKILSEYFFVMRVIMKVPSNFNSGDLSNIELIRMKKFDIIVFGRPSSDEIVKPSTKFLQTILTPEYPMSLWVPEEKEKRDKKLPKALYDMTYKNIHWGQRKLHLSEVDFFMSYTNQNEKYTIVYAGAANGQHIPLLLKLFPNLEFHLYDPAPFSPVVLSNPALKINPFKDSVLPVGFFTDEVAANYTSTDNLLFICDIRLAPSMKKSDPKYAALFEEKVDYDMTIQKDWVNIMKPKFSILKMRLPYYAKEKYEYLDGDVRFQIWAPVASTETRLVVSRTDDEDKFSIKSYAPEVYEKQCAYFNNQMRQMDIGKVTFKSVGIDTDGEFGDLWREYGILINTDCYLETVLFALYLKRIGEEITVSNVKRLIDETSKWLYEDVSPKNAFLKKIEVNKHKKTLV